MGRGFGEQGLGIRAGTNPQGWGTLTESPETGKAGVKREQLQGDWGNLEVETAEGGGAGTERGHQRGHQRGEDTERMGLLSVDSLRWKDSSWEEKQEEVYEVIQESETELSLSSVALLPSLLPISSIYLWLWPPGCGCLVWVPPPSPTPCPLPACQDPCLARKWFSLAQQKGFLEGV